MNAYNQEKAVDKYISKLNTPLKKIPKGYKVIDLTNSGDRLKRFKILLAIRSGSKIITGLLDGKQVLLK